MRLTLISSSLIIKISEQRPLTLLFFVRSVFVLQPGFIFYFLFFSVCLSVCFSPPLQHISSRRHKDRAAGKPAKPKFSPYTPTQRQQSFQAVSTLLLPHLLSSLIGVFVYMSWFSRASSRKLHSLLPMRQIDSDMGWRILCLYCFLSYDVCKRDKKADYVRKESRFMIRLFGSNWDSLYFCWPSGY